MLRLYALTSELPGGPFNPAVYHDITSTGNWVRLITNATTGTIAAYTYAEAEATGFSLFLIGDVVESPTAVTLTNVSISHQNALPLVAALLILLLLFAGMFYRAKRKAI